MDDLRPARAREPDLPAIPPTIQISAALVLSDKGHQGRENMGAGDYHNGNVPGHWRRRATSSESSTERHSMGSTGTDSTGMDRSHTRRRADGSAQTAHCARNDPGRPRTPAHHENRA